MTEPFDKQELLDELDGDREFLEESLEILAGDAPPLLEQLRDATAGRDGEAVRQAAHTLKSMVGNFCAKPAFDAARRIEQLGRDGDLEQGAEAIDALKREMERLQQSLHGFLKELS